VLPNSFTCLLEALQSSFTLKFLDGWYIYMFKDWSNISKMYTFRSCSPTALVHPVLLLPYWFFAYPSGGCRQMDANTKAFSSYGKITHYISCSTCCFFHLIMNPEELSCCRVQSSTFRYSTSYWSSFLMDTSALSSLL
jgi:hypothetical protein